MFGSVYVTPHGCSFVVLSMAKVTTVTPLSYSLSPEFSPSPSFHYALPDNFHVFWFLSLAQKAPLSLPVARGPPFPTATPDGMINGEFLTGFKPGNSALLYLLMQLISTAATHGIKNKNKHQKVQKKGLHYTGRKRYSSPQFTKTPPLECLFSGKQSGSSICPGGT